MNLDIIVYGDITLRQCLYGLGAVVAVFMILKLFKKLFLSRSEPMKHSIPFVCSSCGWQGRIGQFAARCPKCSQPVR
jgi:predicted Zn-ribbon and HTH transcriptional regulator